MAKVRTATVYRRGFCPGFPRHKVTGARLGVVTGVSTLTEACQQYAIASGNYAASDLVAKWGNRDA